MQGDTIQVRIEIIVRVREKWIRFSLRVLVRVRVRKMTLAPMSFFSSERGVGFNSFGLGEGLGSEFGFG